MLVSLTICNAVGRTDGRYGDKGNERAKQALVFFRLFSGNRRLSLVNERLTRRQGSAHQAGFAEPNRSLGTIWRVAREFRP
jgi:hypothetical protein